MASTTTVHFLLLFNRPADDPHEYEYIQPKAQAKTASSGYLEPQVASNPSKASDNARQRTFSEPQYESADVVT